MKTKESASRATATPSPLSRSPNSTDADRVSLSMSAPLLSVSRTVAAGTASAHWHVLRDDNQTAWAGQRFLQCPASDDASFMWSEALRRHVERTHATTKPHPPMINRCVPSKIYIFDDSGSRRWVRRREVNRSNHPPWLQITSVGGGDGRRRSRSSPSEELSTCVCTRCIIVTGLAITVPRPLQCTQLLRTSSLILMASDGSPLPHEFLGDHTLISFALAGSTQMKKRPRSSLGKDGLGQLLSNITSDCDHNRPREGKSTANSCGTSSQAASNPEGKCCKDGEQQKQPATPVRPPSVSRTRNMARKKLRKKSPGCTRLWRRWVMFQESVESRWSVMEVKSPAFKKW